MEIKLKRFDELLRQRYLHRFKLRNLEQAAVDEVLALPASEGLTRLGRLASGWLNDPPIDRWPLERTAIGYGLLASRLEGEGARDSALKALEGMARVLQGVMSASPPNDRVREAYWKCLHRTGDLCIAMGDLSRAHAAYFASLQFAEGQAHAARQLGGWHRRTSVSWNRLGDVRSGPGRPPRRAPGLHRRQEHRRQARRRRPRQRSVAARPLRQLGQARRRARGPGRPRTARSRPTPPARTSAKTLPPPIPATRSRQRDLSLSHERPRATRPRHRRSQGSQTPLPFRPRFSSAKSSPPPIPAARGGSATSLPATTSSGNYALATGDLKGAKRQGFGEDLAHRRKARRLRTRQHSPMAARPHRHLRQARGRLPSPPLAISKEAIAAASPRASPSAKNSPPPSPTTRNGSATSPSAGRGSATCGWPRETYPAPSRPSPRARTSITGSPPPTPATPPDRFLRQACRNGCGRAAARLRGDPLPGGTSRCPRSGVLGSPRPGRRLDGRGAGAPARRHPDDTRPTSLIRLPTHQPLFGSAGSARHPEPSRAPAALIPTARITTTRPRSARALPVLAPP